MRVSRFLNTAVLLVLVPLVLPPFVGAIGLHDLLGRAGSINAMLLWTGTVQETIAYAARRVPFVVRATVAGPETTPSLLVEASRNLGAGGLRALWQITVSLIAANLIAGPPTAGLR